MPRASGKRARRVRRRLTTTALRPARSQLVVGHDRGPTRVAEHEQSSCRERRRTARRVAASRRRRRRARPRRRARTRWQARAARRRAAALRAQVGDPDGAGVGDDMREERSPSGPACPAATTGPRRRWRAVDRISVAPHARARWRRARLLWPLRRSKAGGGGDASSSEESGAVAAAGGRRRQPEASEGRARRGWWPQHGPAGARPSPRAIVGIRGVAHQLAEVAAEPPSLS